MSNVTKSLRRFGIIVGTLASLAMVAVTSGARAASSGNVTLNSVTMGYNFVLILFSSNGAYAARTDASGSCASYNRTAELTKTWYSVAQAALLSGKRVSISYTACGGVNHIETLSIVN